MSNIQHKWDKWLIKGWYGFNKMGWCYNNFAKEYCKELINENGRLKIDAFFGFIEINEIKRCYSLSNNMYHRYPKFKCEVRGFIAMNSPKLSVALFSEHVNRLDIMLNINRYKWVKPKQPSDYKKQWRSNQYFDMLVTGEMIDGATDWSKTKGGVHCNQRLKRN